MGTPSEPKNLMSICSQGLDSLSSRFTSGPSRFFLRWFNCHEGCVWIYRSAALERRCLDRVHCHPRSNRCLTPRVRRWPVLTTGFDSPRIGLATNQYRLSHGNCVLCTSCFPQKDNSAMFGPTIAARQEMGLTKAV